MNRPRPLTREQAPPLNSWSPTHLPEVLWRLVSLEWLHLQILFAEDLRSSIINQATVTDLIFFCSIFIEILFLSQWLPRWPPCLVYRYQRIAIDRTNLKRYQNSHTNSYKDTTEAKIERLEEERELKLVSLADFIKKSTINYKRILKKTPICWLNLNETF